jgi:hypothetical protein
MNFYAREIGHGQHFREHRANVIEMREQTVCAFVRFPAKHFVAVGSELVEKTIFLSRSFLNEPREPSLDCLQFSRMHFEVGMQADEIRLHVLTCSSRWCECRTFSSQLYCIYKMDKPLGVLKFPTVGQRSP